MALADALSAAIAIRNSNRLTSSSSTKMAPAIGALNAVARPAPAPAASNTRQSGQLRRKILPTRWPKVAGHVHARPLAAKRKPDADREHAADELHRNDTKRRFLQLLSENGFDLRDAASDRLGEIQRTSEAAIPAAAAQAATINQTPSGPCA